MLRYKYFSSAMTKISASGASVRKFAMVFTSCGTGFVPTKVIDETEAIRSSIGCNKIDGNGRIFIYWYFWVSHRCSIAKSVQFTFLEILLVSQVHQYTIGTVVRLKQETILKVQKSRLKFTEVETSAKTTHCKNIFRYPCRFRADLVLPEGWLLARGALSRSISVICRFRWAVQGNPF